MSNDYIYHGADLVDPPHQPLYLRTLLRYLKGELNITRVLDAGCGDGNFTASLAEAGLEMYGIDLSSGGIAKARQLYPSIRFFEGSVYDDFNILCEVPAFDAIVSVEVIEHLYSPRSFIRRAYASLRPGGLFIVTTPYWGYLKNLLLSATNRLDHALAPLWEGGHIKHWSYRTLRRLLITRQGFEFVAFHGAGRPIPYLWSGMVMVVRKPNDSASS
jgi:2-polyprenyl-6-hydroxyphenyl methylase/3-demethylubiquinone-9 3-methyltransferase